MPSLAPLPAPRTAGGSAGLAAVVSDPAGTLVACDYDGTLAPIVADPAEARPQPGVVDVLTALAARAGTVAVITGRPAAVAVELGGLDQIPGIVVLGAYGAQRWGSEGGAVAAPALDDRLRADVARLVDEVGPSDARVEEKGAAVAVHLRGTPDPAEAQRVLLGPLTELAESYGLTVEPGRLVVELRPPGTDKGQALLALIAERAARAAVFLGDDLGDLAAFAAVEHFRDTGGCGLTVASRSAEAPEVAEAADLVVDGPPGVVDFLRRLVAQWESGGR